MDKEVLSQCDYSYLVINQNMKKRNKRPLNLLLQKLINLIIYYFIQGRTCINNFFLMCDLLRWIIE